MTTLEELDKHQYSDEIHVGGVKLEGECRGADMVDGGHDALHDESGTHCIINAVLLRHTVLARIKVSVACLEAAISLTLHSNYTYEKNAKDDVAEVAKGAPKILQLSQWFGAGVVEEAKVLVACEVVLLVCVEHHLNRRDGVVDAHDQDALPVHLGLLVF